MNNDVIRNVQESDAAEVAAIFNYFAKESFAVYTAKEIGDDVFERFKNSSRVFLILEVDEKVAGFGLIQPYSPHESFNHTGMLTYFILPQFTGKGYGSKILNRLITDGKEQGITNLVAHISSKNDQSLQFHKKHGFRECGRLTDVGKKFDRFFDVVWVERKLQ